MTYSPAAPRPGVSKWVFVIVGLFLLIPFMGIVAAIAIPNFMTAMQRSKQKRTMADIRGVAMKVEEYGLKHNRFPADLESAGITAPNDAWMRPLWYTCVPQVECTGYAIVSMGADGALEHEDIAEYVDAGGTTNFNSDIVFIDGKFVQYPNTVQVE